MRDFLISWSGEYLVAELLLSLNATASHLSFDAVCMRSNANDFVIVVFVVVVFVVVYTIIMIIVHGWQIEKHRYERGQMRG